MRRGRPRKGRDARLFPTLRELGITKQQSADWQALARIPEAEFERRLATPDPKQMTTAAILGKSPRRRGSVPCPHCGGTGKITT